MRHIAQRADIRDLILDGVDALLARYGFKKMTMEDLAREVGIGKGTIYLHFPSKEELALSHIDRIADRLLLQMREIAASTASPDERIRRMLGVRVLYRFDSVVHYSQNLNDLLSSIRKELLARRERHFEREAKVLAEVVKEGTRRGDFLSPDTLKTAQSLVWSTNALLPFSLSSQELGSRQEIAARVTEITNLLLVGLRRRPAHKTVGKK